MYRYDIVCREQSMTVRSVGDVHQRAKEVIEKVWAGVVNLKSGWAGSLSHKKTPLLLF
jgi:hypothetical protein